MQEVQIVQVRPWYHKPAPWIALGVVTCGMVLAMPHAQRVYHRWSEVRKVERATELLAKKDYQNAALNARGALATSPKHVEATRLMAKICEAIGSPDAIKYRRQLDAIKPGDTENLIGLAAYYLRTGNASAARSALQSIEPQGQNSAQYFDIAAGVSLAQQDLGGAEISAAKAVGLEPANEEYQLRLAALRMSSKQPELRAQALATLQRQAVLPATRVRALRTMLHDALARAENERAVELSEALSESPEATFADRLVHLSTLHTLRVDDTRLSTGGRRVKPADVTATLEKMQAASLAKSEDVFQMLTWMNEHHMALVAQDWIETIPAETTAKPPVFLAVADSYRRSSAWTRLRGLVENANWDKAETVRLAYLSLALEELGDTAGAATAWTKSTDLAQAQPALMELLARETMKWGWKRQSEDLLWKLTAKDNCARWVIDNLWTSSMKRQDPAMLFKLSKLILQAEPKNLAVRNHYVSLALITGQEGDIAQAMAEVNYKTDPDNVAVASTYGLSLFLRGRAEEAVGVMSKFPKEQLRVPALAFYQGIFLAAAGRPDEGEEFFRIGEQAPQFEELIAIRNFLRTVFESDAAERGGQPGESARAWKTALAAAHAQPRWLEILGRMALKWGRIERAGEAVLMLADAGQCPPWAVEPLWSAALRSGDPALVQKVSKVIFDANPKSLEARSNFIMAALLAGKEGEAPGRQADAFLRESPGISEAILPQAYGLYRLGRNDDAVAAMQGLEASAAARPRNALYKSLFLTSVAKRQEAAQFLPAAIDPSYLPEEKTIATVLKLAFDSQAADRAGNAAVASAAWSQAVAQAQSRPELLETLGKATLKEMPERAEEALWKLADSPSVSRWVVDTLAASAEKRRDTAQLYRVARLQRRLDSQNLTVRNNYIWLALLTGQKTDFPDRLARDLYEDNPRNSDVVVTYALSLHQQQKTEKAIELMEGLTPEQLKSTRTALYYGIFLTAAGQEAKARPYLESGSKISMLAEEQALLTKAETRRVSADR